MNYSSMLRAVAALFLGLLATAAHAVTLAELKEKLKFEDQYLIISYETRSNSAYVELNPRMWNRFSESQQRQLCDRFVQSNFVADMKLLNAWFRVGATTIGHIKPGLSGYSWVPAK
jgi:hypothetical protein